MTGFGAIIGFPAGHCRKGPAERSARRRRRVFCVNCGKAYEPSHKFCNHCGYLVPLSAGPSEDDGAHDQPRAAGAASDVVAEDPVRPDAEQLPIPVGPMPVVESAPYALFVSLVLGSVLLISALVFDVAEALVRNRWENTILAVAATLGAALLARSARAAWHRVVVIEPETDAMVKRLHRRVLRNSVIVSLLFFVSAAIVGAAIGKSRDEATRLTADLERMNTVGNRISKARNGVEATIASYAEMYKSIAPEVHDLEATLERLKAELGIYDSKFPAQHEQTSKSIAGMETGLRRTALLKQQIEVAKQIEALDPSDQVAAWKTRMLPLLADEESLDKAK